MGQRLSCEWTNATQIGLALACAVRAWSTRLSWQAKSGTSHEVALLTCENGRLVWSLASLEARGPPGPRRSALATEFVPKWSPLGHCDLRHACGAPAYGRGSLYVARFCARHSAFVRVFFCYTAFYFLHGIRERSRAREKNEYLLALR